MQNSFLLSFWYILPKDVLYQLNIYIYIIYIFWPGGDCRWLWRLTVLWHPAPRRHPPPPTDSQCPTHTRSPNSHPKFTHRKHLSTQTYTLENFRLCHWGYSGWCIKKPSSLEIFKWAFTLLYTDTEKVSMSGKRLFKIWLQICVYSLQIMRL